MATDLVFSKARTSFPSGIDLVFGEGAVTVFRALVYRLGIVRESVPGEEGMYPALHLSAGTLVVGGIGVPLIIDGMTVRQVRAGETATA